MKYAFFAYFIKNSINFKFILNTISPLNQNHKEFDLFVTQKRGPMSVKL